MNISAEWTAVFLSAVALLCGALAWLLRDLKKEIAELRTEFAADAETQAKHTHSIETRLREHVENEDRHLSRAWLDATAEWRKDMTSRFDKLELLILGMLSKH